MLVKTQRRVIQAVSWYRFRDFSTSLTRPSQYVQPPFHSDYDPKFEEQTFKLQDGRTIGFAEYGSRSSKSGTQVFFFHGGPGCRYDALGYHDIAKKLDARIVCPDRPGHGLSTHDPKRKLVDYSSEISQLAHHLKMDKYHVFGQSGGGPYAVACAHNSPKNELLRATVVAGMGPPACVNRKEAGLYTTIALWFHLKAPGLLQKFWAWQYGPKFLHDDEAIQKSLNRMYRLLPKKDRECMSAPEAQATIRAILRAAFIQGGWGPLRDGQIYASQDLWGFELKDVERKVHLIYADSDNRTPLAFAKRYQAGLRNSDLWIMKDATHFRMDQYVDQIFARVVGKELPTDAENEKKKAIDAEDTGSASPAVA